MFYQIIDLIKKKIPCSKIEEDILRNKENKKEEESFRKKAEAHASSTVYI